MDDLHMTDCYTTLGLLPDAEDVVIKAAYRALSNAYHPDKNSSTDATLRMSEINAAYDILSNPEKKRIYDLEMRSNKASFSEFDREEQYTLNEIEEAWNLAVNFYPNITELYEDLKLLSWRLAFNFKIKLIEEKSFSSAEKIALHAKESHLKKYFGSNKEINGIAEHLIKAKELEPALYLNQVINTLGQDVSIIVIKENISKKFPKSLEKAELCTLYIRASKNYIRSAEKLIKKHNGKVRQHIFTDKYTVNIDGNTIKIDTPYKLCRWVTEYFKKIYA